MNNVQADTKTPAQLAEIRRLEAERRHHAAKVRSANEQLRILKASKPS